jgi:hypothetical protein
MLVGKCGEETVLDITRATDKDLQAARYAGRFVAENAIRAHKARAALSIPRHEALLVRVSLVRSHMRSCPSYNLLHVGA